MRAFPRLAILPLLIAAGGGSLGCGAERAVRVAIEGGDDRGDTLCLVAAAEGEVVFALAYPIALLPESERSLTFVAGSRVSETLALSASILRDGQVTARDAAIARFATQGTVAQTLRPGRCRAGGPPGIGQRPGGTFAALAATPRAIGVDVDGDGADELLAIGADGSLQVLEAADRDAGSRRATELRAPAGVLAGAGDLDGDCRLEVVAAAPTGALVVIGASGASPSPIGDPALDAALGVRADDGRPGVAIAGASGLAITPWSEDAPRVVASGAFAHVRTADLTGDGRGDLIASGDAGTRVVIAQPDGWRDEPGALPAAIAALHGPFALGDLDGDGAIDLVASEGGALRIALNRGDGLLEDRSGTSAPVLDAGAARLETADLDGDCADEIVALDAAGALVVLGRDARGEWVRRRDAPAGRWADLAVLDANGDGTSEIALLDPTGAVTLWRP